MKAITNGHRAVALHLLEKTDRAIMEIPDRLGRRPLHYAAAAIGHAASGGEKSGGASAAAADLASVPAGDNMYEWLVEHGADEKQADDVRFNNGSVLSRSSSYMRRGLGA